VWLAFRVFDPATRTHSQAARDLGLADWSAILGHVIRRDVEVRILLSDFEPILADHLHAGSWHGFRSFREIAEKFNAAETKLLQLVVAQHEGEFGWVWRQMPRLPLRGIPFADCGPRAAALPWSANGRAEPRRR